MLDCCLERMVGILLHFPILVIFPPHIVITFCVRYKMSLSGSFPDSCPVVACCPLCTALLCSAD